MGDVIITQKNIRATIILEDSYSYNVDLTIGLTQGNDFYLKIVYLDLKLEDLKQLDDLFTQTKELKIQSEFFEKEDYSIEYIVAEKSYMNSNMEVCWECLSDTTRSLIIGL